MTSNIGNYGNNTLFPTQDATNTHQQNRVSRLFGSRDDAKDVSDGVVYGQGSRTFSSMYTAKGTHLGTRIKEQLAKFDKRTSVQKVLDKISRDAYTDWKDTALYHKMSLVSQLYEKREEEPESAESALYEKEVYEASRPYPAKDMLTGDRAEKQTEPQAAKFSAKNVSEKDNAGLRF